VVQVIIQEHGWKQAEFERRARSEPFDDLPRRLIFFVRVGPRKVEIELVGVHSLAHIVSLSDPARTKRHACALMRRALGQS